MGFCMSGWFSGWSDADIIGVIGGGALSLGLAAGTIFEKLRSPHGRRMKFERDQAIAERNEARREAERTADKSAQQQSQLSKLDELRTALDGEEDELWNLHGADAPLAVRKRLAQMRLKIITVMNLKGGVGKTTTVANLAAYFATKNKRVLVIDLDYQGSLTGILVSAGGFRTPKNAEALATHFLSGEHAPESLARQVSTFGSNLENIDLIGSGIAFDRFENRAMLRWLIGDETDDIRFRLAHILTSAPFEPYDIVLIDAPPRMSLGAINALMTSHALLMPTVLDGLSVSALNTMVSRTNKIKVANPSLRYAGVVGTLRGSRGDDVVEDARIEACKTLKNWNGTSHLYRSEIKYFTDLARLAGTDLAYKKHPGVRDAYIALGDELASEISL